MRNVSPFPSRRFAAGIDVGAHEVRLVIVSRTRREKWPIGVEWMGTASLAAGAVCGARLVDRTAVSAALSLLCARWPRRRAMRSMSCLMAMPGEGAGDTAAVEGAVGAVGAAVTRNLHLEARAEVAAAAGIALAAVDNESEAALRALAHAAERTLRPGATLAALWAGYDGIHGWRIADGTVRARIRFPAGEHADLESALRSLAGNEGLDQALVGGDIALFERVGLALPDIGECLGCTVVPFECTSLRASGAALGNCADWRRAAAFAVAFGLALRGVAQ